MRDRLPRFLFTALCLLVILVQWVVVLDRRSQTPGHFDILREFGERFLAGRYLYEHGVAYNYLPTAALLNAPLALVSPTTGFAIRYAAAVCSVWLTLHLLGLMLDASTPRLRAARFAVGASVVLLGAHYIVRDLDDAGPHLILLVMLVGGMYCASKARTWSAASLFGLATALKAPCGLMLPFLIWKRRWRLAAASTLATVAWIALPMVWMGPASWRDHHVAFVRTALDGVESNEHRLQNQALFSAVRQFLVEYPIGHAQRSDHPWFRPLAALSPDAAFWIAALLACALVAGFCWWTRRPTPRPEDPRWLLETSGVLILMNVLSPVTWIQHLVLMVPALYLIATEAIVIRPLGRPAWTAMTLYAILALALNREVLGRETYLLLLAYHTHTMALFLVLGVVVFRRPTAAADAPSPVDARCPITTSRTSPLAS